MAFVKKDKMFLPSKKRVFNSAIERKGGVIVLIEPCYNKKHNIFYDEVIVCPENLTNRSLLDEEWVFPMKLKKEKNFSERRSNTTKFTPKKRVKAKSLRKKK